uniref:Oligopeptide transporter 3 n=2 Tax=Zea mays TaxID=4577 RepID=A0A804M423_MAIZE
MASRKSPVAAEERAGTGTGEGKGERCAVEEVALVVPETDDPSMPVMTFRAWALGLGSCVVLIFLNTFFTYRTQPLTISGILAQILVLPAGRFLAAVLPDREVRILGGRLGSFNLNPGPFNVKEHVIITIFANCGVSYGGGDAYSIGAITVMKAYYKQTLSFACALLIVLTTQILGYGWAGLLRRYLVDPAEMWWPSNLAQVSLFRALHEKEEEGGKSRGPSRMRFFLIVFFASFAYYALPGFPIFSNQLFTASGQKYDTTKVLTKDFDLNVAAYDSYGKLYLSPLFAISIGSGFLRFTATIVHVLLFHGSDMWKQSKSAMNAVKLDVHAKLMQRYRQVPQWWFLMLLLGSVVVSLLMSFVWKEEMQLPWWGMLFAFALAFVVTLPIGVIQATTNQQPGYDIIAQFMIGYALPGKPIANLLFKIYGRISTVHALSFLADLKLGHYMKIPPRCMYTAQLVGTVVAGVVNLAVAWWMLDNIENICDVEALHPDSPWTCPKYRVTFDASVIWGLIGPGRLFGQHGLYRNLVWLFLVGAVLPVPVWLLSRAFPEKKWIALINVPVISYGFAGMPPATPTNIATWLVTGTIFNYFVFRYRKGWWQKYNYVLSAALDAGTAFMGVLIFFALQNAHHELKWWGTEVDHCPLASCPTAPGIAVKGCPVF